MKYHRKEKDISLCDILQFVSLKYSVFFALYVQECVFIFRQARDTFYRVTRFIDWSRSPSLSMISIYHLPSKKVRKSPQFLGLWTACKREDGNKELHCARDYQERFLGRSVPKGILYFDFSSEDERAAYMASLISVISLNGLWATAYKEEVSHEQ